MINTSPKVTKSCFLFAFLDLDSTMPLDSMLEKQNNKQILNKILKILLK